MKRVISMLRSAVTGLCSSSRFSFEKTDPLFSRVTIIFMNNAYIGDPVFSISFLEFDVFQILDILVGI